MNRLFWVLPGFVHTLIVRLFGWRLVMVIDDETKEFIEFRWRKE